MDIQELLCKIMVHSRNPKNRLTNGISCKEVDYKDPSKWGVRIISGLWHKNVLDESPMEQEFCSRVADLLLLLHQHDLNKLCWMTLIRQQGNRL